MILMEVYVIMVITISCNEARIVILLGRRNGISVNRNISRLFIIQVNIHGHKVAAACNMSPIYIFYCIDGTY